MHHLRRAVGKYISLSVMGMIGLSCYILADTFMIAKSLGAVGLASLNFSISVFSLMHGLALMIGIGAATRFSISKSDKQTGREAFAHALMLGAVMAAVFVTVGVFLTAPLSRLLGADDVTLPMTTVYLKTILCFSPFFILNNICLAFVRNDSQPRLAMTAMLVSSLSNIVLDYVFIFPLSMGMFGAAFATVLSPVISVGVLSLHWLGKKSSVGLQKCRIRLFRVKDIVSLGFSSFIGELASAVALMTFNLVILHIAGHTGVAAYGIVANIALVVISVFTGIAQGVQPLASRFYGRQDQPSLSRILRDAVAVSLIFSVLLYAAMFFLSDAVVSAFNGEGDAVLQRIASRGMIVYFAGFFFAGVNIIAAAFLSATSRYKSAMLIAVLRSCAILVPMAIVLSAFFKMTGVWASFVATEFIVCVVSVFCLYRLRHADN